MEMSKCDNCGKQLIYEFNTTSYAISKTLNKLPCKDCYSNISETETFYFCNLNCAKEWLMKQ